jgi:endonuclease III related protein
VFEKEPADLDRYYRRLLEELGAQRWWPARTRWEVILGAILTQNTTWRNAALALARLRAARLLGLRRLAAVPEARLRSLVRPSGFFRQKARTISGFLDWLERTHGGSLRKMFARPAEKLRAELLRLKGLGPETVDAILLYAGRQPFFVADAYSRRILARHGLVPERAGYAAVQEFVHRHLRRDPDVYNEFHALLVEVGKRYCRRQTPICEACPLERFLPGVN